MILERNQNWNQYFRETLESESESESIVTGIGIESLKMVNPGIEIGIGISPSGIRSQSES